MIPIGTLDRVSVVIGERGTGKSTWALLDARVFQRETGGVVIGHSPRGQIGRADDVRMHNTVKKAAKAIRHDTASIHIVTDDTPEMVVDFARDLALAFRKQAHRDKWIRFRENRPPQPGLRAPPVLAIIDEGTHSKGDLSKEAKRELEMFLTSTRHEHLAITFLSQAPTARSWTYQEQASRFRVFRYLHEWGLNALRAAAIPQEHLERIRDLPRFEYFRLDKIEAGHGRFERLPSPK